MRFDEDGIFGLYSRLYENRREVEYSLEDYLRACSDDPAFYAGAAERLLKAAFAIPSPLVVQEFNKREWPEFLLARGRVDDALAAANRLIAHQSPVIRAAGHVEAGHAMLVTAFPSPQGLITLKWSRSGATFSANPCIVTFRLMATPIAPILASPTQTPG